MPSSMTKKRKKIKIAITNSPTEYVPTLTITPSWWYRDFGKQINNFSLSETCIDHMTQDFHSQ